LTTRCAPHRGNAAPVPASSPSASSVRRFANPECLSVGLQHDGQATLPFHYGVVLSIVCAVWVQRDHNAQEHSKMTCIPRADAAGHHGVGYRRPSSLNSRPGCVGRAVSGSAVMSSTRFKRQQSSASTIGS
jgi:hypothetical protein